MSNFMFIEKEQELHWWIDNTWHKVYMKYVNDSIKYTIREWVENECVGNVVVFARTRWPKQGEGDWANTIKGDGSIDIYFKNADDAAYFKLTWLNDDIITST